MNIGYALGVIRSEKQMETKSTSHIAPKPRDATYVALDERIDAAKVRLRNTTEHLWNVPNFVVQNWQPDDFQFLNWDFLLS